MLRTSTKLRSLLHSIIVATSIVLLRHAVALHPDVALPFLDAARLRAALRPTVVVASEDRSPKKRVVMRRGFESWVSNFFGPSFRPVP
jgi:hypothetical protein